MEKLFLVCVFDVGGLLFSLFAIFSFYIPSVTRRCSGPIVGCDLPSPAIVGTSSNCCCLCTARGVEGLPVRQSGSVMG